MRNYLRHNRILTDDDRMSVTLSYMDGNAKAWATTYFNALLDTNVVPSFDDFIEESCKHFEVYDTAQQARRKLDALKQTGEAKFYAQAFRLLAEDADLSPSDLLHRAHEGLSNEIKVALAVRVARDKPKTWNDLLKDAEEIYGALKAARSEPYRLPFARTQPQQTQQTRPPPNSGFAPRPAFQPTFGYRPPVAQPTQNRPLPARDPNVMDVDRMKQRAEGRCYKCGQKGHLQNACPQNAGQTRPQQWVNELTEEQAQQLLAALDVRVLEKSQGVRSEEDLEVPALPRSYHEVYEEERVELREERVQEYGDEFASVWDQDF